MQEQLAKTNSHLTSKQKIENSELDLSLAGYDYELPTELIAQNPAVPRDSSRLLVVSSANVDKDDTLQHRIFRDLPEILRPGDLLVMNNTRVIPARLYGEKLTGAEVEVLLLEERQHNCWLALVKPGKRFKHGSKIVFTAKGKTDGEIGRWGE
ncbi:S-adenosylmethionine:tRNA ribosyltransferase-isomerase, partial [Fischerella thermalis]